MRRVLLNDLENWLVNMQFQQTVCAIVATFCVELLHIYSFIHEHVLCPSQRQAVELFIFKNPVHLLNNLLCGNCCFVTGRGINSLCFVAVFCN